MLHGLHSQIRGHAKAHDAWSILSTGAPAALLTAAMNQRRKLDAIAHIKSANSLGAMHLVSREREHIDSRRGRVERDSSRRLHGIAVKQGSGIMSHRCQYLDRKHNAGFIIGPLNGNECGSRT